jgi:hypothetical protein
MADDVTITPGSGATIAADDVGGVKYQRVKVVWGPDGTANDTDVASGKPLPVQLRTAAGAAVEALNTTAAGTSDTEAIGVQGVDAGVPVPVVPKIVTVSTDITRPNDTNAYTANDAWSDSTSAPTSGGFTFTSAARASGGSGRIVDAIIATSADAATLLQGEIWIFDTSVTNVNDNAAFVFSDAEAKTYVGKIPFTLEDAGNNGTAHVTGLDIGFTCVGSANLRYLVKVKNAYTPAAQEVLTVRLKIEQA